MSEKIKTNGRIMARETAPEDIRSGHFIAALYFNFEVLSDSAVEESAWRQPRPVPVQCLPPATGHPLRVIDVCLPFVLARDVDGDLRTIDTRRWRLARVTKRFGRAVFEGVKAKQARDRKRAKGDCNDD